MKLGANSIPHPIESLWFLIMNIFVFGILTWYMDQVKILFDNSYFKDHSKFKWL